MHDLDRALKELEPALESASYGSDQEYETDGEAEYEYDGETERESRDDEAMFDELEEMEEAAALLEVQDEGELEHFLGSLIGKVKKKLGVSLPFNLQQALGGALKRVAQSALPKVGAALGNLVVPGVGGVVGANLVSNAGRMFGLELEGLSYEDQQFEVARRVVNLGAEATKTAAAAAQGANGAPASQTAKDAILQAAQTHAPGLVSAGPGRWTSPRVPGPGGAYGGQQRTGRWVRRGRRIILFGV